MRRLFACRVVVCACAVAFGAACGAGPAKSAADAEAAPASDEAPAATQPDESQSAAPASDSAAGEASVADVQAVLQLVLDDEALTPYLHLELPERFPLRVSTRNLPKGIELVKATKPVELVDDPGADKKPLLVFMEVDVKKDSANVRYRYDIEGIRGACTLERRDGNWTLKKSRVTER
jgi:hypothetical protein